jgi:hypothetical protein
LGRGGDAAVAGEERGNAFQVESVAGGELDSCRSGDFFGERAEADAVPVDDAADGWAGPDDVAVLQVAVGPSVRAFGLLVGWSGGGVFVDERDPLVEQVDHGLVERSAGEPDRAVGRCPRGR